MAGDVFRIHLPEAASPDDAAELASALRDVDGVVETAADTRSLAAALVLVQVVGGALADVSTALPVVQKVVALIRGKGVTGAKIELPDGTKIAVDSASIDELERLIGAATPRR